MLFIFVHMRWSITAILLASAPAYAQENDALRALLPTMKADGTARPDTANVNSPELHQIETQTGNPLNSDDQSQQGIRVGSVLIETTAAIDHAMFEKAIEPFLGSSATKQDLAKLAQQIATIARSEGMMLAKAHIPEQQIELGIVRVVLDSGMIDEVRIEGSSNTALRALLDPLAGRAVMQNDLERRLALANNIPQIVVKQTELLTKGGKRTLIVKVEERSKTNGQLVFDNFGSSNLGPIRARLSIETAALLNDSDFMNVTFRTNPIDPGELLAASVTYGIGLNNNGTRAEVATAWSKSNIKPSFGFGKRNAKSQYASLSVNHPLQRSRTSNLSVEGQFEYLKIEQDSLGALLQSDTVVTVSVGLTSSQRVGNGWLRAGTQLRQGLGILGANERNATFSSRRDASGRFTSARAWINWSGKPVGNMTLRLAVSGQVATTPLLSSEETGLGGAYIGRAFDFFERSGDRGVLALAELGYEFSEPAGWLKRLQPYAFVDGGYVDNIRGGFGGGTLISAGGGIRADIGAVGLQFETAIPVYATGDGGSSREPKVNLQVGLGF